jgi:hypothetical protein
MRRLFNLYEDYHRIATWKVAESFRSMQRDGFKMAKHMLINYTYFFPETHTLLLVVSARVVAFLVVQLLILVHLKSIKNGTIIVANTNNNSK